VTIERACRPGRRQGGSDARDAGGRSAPGVDPPFAKTISEQATPISVDCSTGSPLESFRERPVSGARPVLLNDRLGREADPNRPIHDTIDHRRRQLPSVEMVCVFGWRVGAHDRPLGGAGARGSTRGALCRLCLRGENPPPPPGQSHHGGTENTERWSPGRTASALVQTKDAASLMCLDQCTRTIRLCSAGKAVGPGSPALRRPPSALHGRSGFGLG